MITGGLSGTTTGRSSWEGDRIPVQEKLRDRLREKLREKLRDRHILMFGAPDRKASELTFPCCDSGGWLPGINSGKLKRI